MQALASLCPAKGRLIEVKVLSKRWKTVAQTLAVPCHGGHLLLQRGSLSPRMEEDKTGAVSKGLIEG
jgi:hypothetical protein